MTICYLGLGANLGSPERQLQQAIAALRRLPNIYIQKVASFYTSKCWGRKGLPHYCNTVVSVKTNLMPRQLLSLCQKIEVQQGRIRKIRWGARTLDIDLLLYGSAKMNAKELQLPHPRLHERDFVFVPLLEIAEEPIMIDGILLNHLITLRKKSFILKKG